MKIELVKGVIVLAVLLSTMLELSSQDKSIQDLDFLIGTWEVKEENKEKSWWEKSTRTGRYTLDSTYIELESVAISSSGKERVYRWFIHYNSKAQQFEMVSIFSNWHEVLFDVFHWDLEKRTLTIRNGKEPDTNEYHERFGEIVFNDTFNKYIWTGENKYGDPDDPSIWKYIETGLRTK